MQEGKMRQSLRETFYDFIEDTEKIRNGKTFISVPKYADIASLNHPRSKPTHLLHSQFPRHQPNFIAPSRNYSQPPTHWFPEKPSHYDHSSDDRDQDQEILVGWKEDSLSLLHKKESKIELHDSAVHTLINNLDRVFDRPERVYGDIEPDEELMPSQVTLLRLRRKKQNISVARYHFERAVTKYIIEWRNRILKKYHALYSKQRATHHRLSKAFYNLQGRVGRYNKTVKRQRQAIKLSVFTRMIMFFSAWVVREKMNRRSRGIAKKFSLSFCAWRLWRRAFHKWLSRAVVGMMADMKTYDFLMKKHGKVFLRALSVKVPRVYPERIAEFSYFHTLRRGFLDLLDHYEAGKIQKEKHTKFMRSKIKKKFRQWCKHTNYCKAKHAVIVKEIEIAKRRRLEADSNALKMGLERYLDVWKQLPKNNWYLNVCSEKSRHHCSAKERRAATSALSIWRERARFNSRDIKAAAQHAFRVKSLQFFSLWRRFAQCQSEHSAAENHNFVKFKKYYGRKCLVNKTKRKENIAVSKRKLDVIVAALHYKRTLFRSLTALIHYEKDRRSQALEMLALASRHHRLSKLWTALQTLIQFRKDKDDHDNRIYVSDMQFCISNMRFCLLRWRGNTRAGGGCGTLKRQSARAAAHWREARCARVLATLADIINARRKRTKVAKNQSVDDSSLMSFLSTGRMFSKESKVHLKEEEKKIVCKSGRPIATVHSLTFLLLLAKAHESKRLVKKTLIKWTNFLKSKYENLHYEQQIEEQHYFRYLQHIWFQALRRHTKFVVRLKSYQSQMDSYHATLLLKCRLKQWQGYYAQGLERQRDFKTIDAFRGRNLLVRGIWLWRSYAMERKKKNKIIFLKSVPFAIKQCQSRFVRALMCVHQQARLEKEAARSCSRRSLVISTAQWRAQSRQSRSSRSSRVRGGVKYLAWTFKMFKKRVAQQRRRKCLDEESFDSTSHHYFDFKTRGSLKCVRIFSKRRKILKSCFSQLRNKIHLRKKRIVFNAFLKNRAECLSSALCATSHFKHVHGKKAVLSLREHCTHRSLYRRKVFYGAKFHSTYQMISFFRLYDQNIKSPLASHRKNYENAKHHYLLHAQRWLLEKWIHDLVNKRHMRAQVVLTAAFKRQRFFKNIQLMSKKTQRFKQLIKLALNRNEKVAFKQWTAKYQQHALMKRKIVKASDSFRIRWQTKIFSFLKREQRLRSASVATRRILIRHHFNLFYQLYIFLFKGGRFFMLTKKAARKIELNAMKAAIRDWRETIRLEKIAIGLVVVRAEKMYNKTILLWHEFSKNRIQRNLYINLSLQALREVKEPKILLNVLSAFSIHIERSKLEKNCMKKIKKNLLHCFSKRLLERASTRVRSEARDLKALLYCNKSLLSLGLKYLMYHVRMKYLRQHEAYLHHREDRRAKLRLALKKLYSNRKKAKQRRHANVAIQKHRILFKKLRVMQFLDGAVARRWARNEEVRIEGEKQRVKLLRRGLQRLICHQKKKSNESKKRLYMNYISII